MSLKLEALIMKASNLSGAASTVQQYVYAPKIHVARPCLVHAGILLFTTTQCLRLFAASMPGNFSLGAQGTRRSLGPIYCLILTGETHPFFSDSLKLV
jgi:hypothetical protein